MADEVAIFNRALTRLGDITITSFTQDTNIARTAQTIYEQCRDGLVADYPWTFAMARTLLPALAEVPAYQYAHKYQLPADCFRVWEVNGGWSAQDVYAWGWSGSNLPGGVPAGFDPFNITDYVIEGSQLLTNINAPLPLRYVRLVTDSTRFPPTFVSALVLRLAIESCVRVTGSDALVPGLEQEFRYTIARAKKADAIQRPPQKQRDAEWPSARFRG